MKKQYYHATLIICIFTLLPLLGGCLGGMRAADSMGRMKAHGGSSSRVKQSKVKAVNVVISGVTVGMSESEVQAKLGKGSVMEGMDGVIDYGDVTVFLDKNRHVQSVSGTASDMNARKFTLEVDGKKVENNLDSYQFGVALETPGERTNVGTQITRFTYPLDGGFVRADYGPAAAITIMVGSNP